VVSVGSDENLHLKTKVVTMCWHAGSIIYLRWQINMEALVEWWLAGKTKVHEKESAILSTWIYLWFNSGIQSEPSNHLRYSTSTYNKKLNKNKYSHKIHGEADLNFFSCASCLTHVPVGCALQQHNAKLLTLELKPVQQPHSTGFKSPIPIWQRLMLIIGKVRNNMLWCFKLKIS
jgi:hypothetical protein